MKRIVLLASVLVAVLAGFIYLKSPQVGKFISHEDVQKLGRTQAAQIYDEGYARDKASQAEFYRSKGRESRGAITNCFVIEQKTKPGMRNGFAGIIRKRS